MENKEKLLSLVKGFLEGKVTFGIFSTQFDECYWADGVHGSLDEIDNEFFYRVCECTTYVDDKEAGNWGMRSTEDYLKWLDNSFKEYLGDKDAWYKRVKSEEEMWV